MKTLEIILKLAFLAGAVSFITTQSISSIGFIVFLVISFVLGIVLIINKDSSYSKAQTKKDYAIRKTEGGLLIIFSVVTFYVVVNMFTLVSTIGQ